MGCGDFPQRAGKVWMVGDEGAPTLQRARARNEHGSEE